MSGGSSALLNRLLDVIRDDVAPKTREGVSKGNKLFGAAILKKSDLSLIIADTNNEIENPLWHGEVHTITKLYARGPPSAVPDPKECIFLATHEPCSLCLSAITWAGYDNFYFLFSHQDSRDSFGIPHDIKILKEVFAVPSQRGQEIVQSGQDLPLYNRENAFWKSLSIVELIKSLDDLKSRETLLEKVKNIEALYGELSDVYQASKGGKGIPLA